MGNRVSEQCILLSNLINDGIASGYSGNNLKDCVVSRANVEFGIKNREFVEGFVDSIELKCFKIEEDIFNV